MSRISIVENVNQITNGHKVHALQFVRDYTPLAAAVSKAVPSTEAVPRDATGNRKIAAPDVASMLSIHRNISRRNKDAKMTLQMLPDLKLATEMVVSLIMSPKDMYNDEVVILSDSQDLLPASLMASMLAVVTDYYRKNHDLSDFLQRMLMECMAYQGALPVAIIPENALDDMINNYNANLSLESFKGEFDVEKNLAHPIGLLGVPDYLSPQKNKNIASSGKMKFGSAVSFSLESFETHRSMTGDNRMTTSNAGIALSKLAPGKVVANAAVTPWVFKADAKGESTTQFDADQLIFVTDNVSAMKMPLMRGASLESRVHEVIKKKGFGKLEASLESLAETFKKQQLEKSKKDGRTPNDNEVEGLLFKNRRFAHTPVASLRSNSQLKRNSVGEPMIKEFDTACFIPVSVEGDPTRKLGGFVMLDEEGYPLTTYNAAPEDIIDMASYAGGQGNFISSMNERSNSVMNGKDCSGVPNYMLKKFFTGTFAQLVEKDMIDRVKNGQYDNGVQLGSNEDFYWLMMTRAMKGQRTQLLWIPAEFLVYFAMDYDELGFGKSLLDDIRNITSMRIMLMVAGIAASLKNSIGRTKVSIKLDEEDPDASKTLEDIQDEILKSRMNPIPFGVNNVADISKYLQRACYEFEITGSTAIPDMAITFDQYNTQYPKPDEELQSQLKDLSIQHFGLTKDMIDAADGVEFAIQAATSNMLTMKRVMRWQRKVVPQASEYIRKISLNSEAQINSLRDLVKNNFGQLQVDKVKRYFGMEDESLMQDENFKRLVTEQCLNAFINNLFVELPSPASTTLQAQRDEFDAAADFYKAALEYVVNESFFDTSIQGEGLSDHVDMIKNILLSHYMRDFMSKNNILPELAELTIIGEDNKVGMNVMDSLEKHIKALGMSTENFFSRFKEFAIKQTGLMAAVPEGSTTGETETSAGSGDSGGGGGYGGSDDDFDFDDPIGGPGGTEDEEPDEETSTTETTETTTTETSGGEEPL